ncbi:MAG: MucB/RseB C-terminal domain-containing protein, partial [Gammaproteobacteria bacterium]
MSGWPPGAVGWRGVLLVACAAMAAPVLAADDARGWLVRMGEALEFLNYEGTLVQFDGSEVAVMRVVHRVEDGKPTERITAMDEVGREIIRGGDDLTCILPDQHAVIVEKRGNDGKAASPLRQQFSGDLHFDDRYYQLTIATGGKLVGRDTRVITVRPTDGYRYGYRLWLDRATAIPLKVQIAGDDGVVVEQLLFSDISLPERIPASAVQPSMTTASFTLRRRAATPALAPVPAGAGWRVDALPPGFGLLDARSQTADGASAPMEQLVYSDGVARVSVFIEGGVAPAEQAGGVSRMGAANAFTIVAGDYLVTAVGEVPLRTVEAIA